jgi:hypothetical protein
MKKGNKTQPSQRTQLCFQMKLPLDWSCWNQAGGGGGETWSKYLTHRADDLEADGAGLELGALGLLIPLRIPPLRVDLLLLPARHPLESTACHN